MKKTYRGAVALVTSMALLGFLLIVIACVSNAEEWFTNSVVYKFENYNEDNGNRMITVTDTTNGILAAMIAIPLTSPGVPGVIAAISLVLLSVLAGVTAGATVFGDLSINSSPLLCPIDIRLYGESVLDLDPHKTCIRVTWKFSYQTKSRGV